MECPAKQTNKHGMSSETNKHANNHNIGLRILVYQTSTRGGENILCSLGLHSAERGHLGEEI